MLPAARALDRLCPVNANFTYAINIIFVEVVIRLVAVARAHPLQRTIAEHGRTLFAAGPETVYQQRNYGYRANDD